MVSKKDFATTCDALPDYQWYAFWLWTWKWHSCVQIGHAYFTLRHFNQPLQTVPVQQINTVDFSDIKRTL